MYSLGFCTLIMGDRSRLKVAKKKKPKTRKQETNKTNKVCRKIVNGTFLRTKTNVQRHLIGYKLEHHPFHV